MHLRRGTWPAWCTMLTGHPMIPACSHLHSHRRCVDSKLNLGCKGQRRFNHSNKHLQFWGMPHILLHDSTWCHLQKYFTSFNIGWLCFQDSCTVWISAYSWDYPRWRMILIRLTYKKDSLCGGDGYMSPFVCHRCKPASPLNVLYKPYSICDPNKSRLLPVPLKQASA